MRRGAARAGRGSPAGHRLGTDRAVCGGQRRPADPVRRPLSGTGLTLRLWIILWSIRWRSVCRGGQPGVNCGWLVDGQRILKLLPETPCAVPEIGVEISSPPGTVTGEGETPSHPAKDNPGAFGPGESPAPPARRELRATRQRTAPGFRARGGPALPARRKLRATGAGETPYHPVPGRLRGLWPRESAVPPGKRETRKGEPRATRRRENFEVRGGGETLSQVTRRKLWATAKGKLQIVRWRGNPEPRDEKKALSPPAKRILEPFGLGETPVIW